MFAVRCNRDTKQIAAYYVKLDKAGKTNDAASRCDRSSGVRSLARRKDAMHNASIPDGSNARWMYDTLTYEEGNVFAR